jgi:hypothetical protein
LRIEHCNPRSLILKYDLTGGFFVLQVFFTW